VNFNITSFFTNCLCKFTHNVRCLLALLSCTAVSFPSASWRTSQDGTFLMKHAASTKQCSYVGCWTAASCRCHESLTNDVRWRSGVCPALMAPYSLRQLLALISSVVLSLSVFVKLQLYQLPWTSCYWSRRTTAMQTQTSRRASTSTRWHFPFGAFLS